LSKSQKVTQFHSTHVNVPSVAIRHVIKYSMMLKMANTGYCWQPIMAPIMQLSFKFWCTAYHTGHLTPSPDL